MHTHARASDPSTLRLPGATSLRIMLARAQTTGVADDTGNVVLWDNISVALDCDTSDSTSECWAAVQQGNNQLAHGDGDPSLVSSTPWVTQPSSANVTSYNYNGDDVFKLGNASTT